MMKCAQLDRNMNITNIWNFQRGLNGIPSRNIEIVIGHATPDQEKDIRENDRDRDRGEGDRQDINLKKESVVVQYWNVFIPPLDVEEVVQGTVFLLMINYIKMYISFHYFRSYFENHMKSIKFVFEIGLPFKIT